MKRTFLAAAALSIAAIAQQPVPPIQKAYRAWRSNHPELERDSTKSEPGYETRVEKSSTDQAKYAAARKELLEGMRDEAKGQLGRVESLGLRISQEQGETLLDTAVAAANAANNASREAVGTNSDRGLRPLRQALDGERATLQALAASLANRRKINEDLADAANTAELARANVREKYSSLASGFEQEAQAVERQQLAWTEYYRLLNARGRTTRETGFPPATLPAAATRSASPRVSDPAPAPASRSLVPLPLSRYVGDWQYSVAARVFKGLEPEFAELSVREQDGQAKGTLNVRFKAAPDSPPDRSVRFDFAGPLQATRNQSFRLETADGLKGTIELVPGTAINLIEVKFETDARPGKANTGNFVLLKK